MAVRTAPLSSGWPHDMASGATVTRYAPGESWGAQHLTAARSRRRNLFRFTALPHRRPTEKATSGNSVATSGGIVQIRHPHRSLAPPTRRSSQRSEGGSTSNPPDRGAHGRSHGQPVAPLEPTGPQDSPSGTARHAAPEAMGLRPLPRVGLVGPLHVCHPFTTAEPGGSSGSSAIGGAAPTNRSSRSTLARRSPRCYVTRLALPSRRPPTVFLAVAFCRRPLVPAPPWVYLRPITAQGRVPQVWTTLWTIHGVVRGGAGGRG